MEIKSKYVKSHNTTLYNGKITVIAEQYAPVTFGKYNAVGSNCTFISTNHDVNYPCLQYTMYRRMWNDSHPGVKLNTENHNKKTMEIQSACWFGEGVFVCPGVKIGNGCVIGAHTVVTKNVSPYSVIVGNPGREIKKRFSSSMIDFLESDEGRWFDWPTDKIKRNKTFFYTDLSEVTVEQLRLIIIY